MVEVVVDELEVASDENEHQWCEMIDEIDVTVAKIHNGLVDDEVVDDEWDVSQIMVEGEVDYEYAFV